MSNQALFEKLDQTTELLSAKLIELIKLSSIEQADNENADTAVSDIAIATTGVTLVNNQTMQLVKGVKDLLVLTRSIREKWLLNQIPEHQTDEKDMMDTDELQDLLARCINEIVNEPDAELNV